MIAPGQTIGSYRVLRQIGAGGMGVVFEAVHEHIGRRAAIKVLHPRFAQDPTMLNRFFNEARAVNIVQHPSIVAIFECGRLPDETAFIIMEYLEGQTLSERLCQNAGRAGPNLLPLCRQVASALAAAHERDIVHRDLKPDNIMLVRDPEVPDGERVKVLDFGIAKVALPPGQGAEAFRTRMGAIMGTPAYMAPEQCYGAEEATDRADVYSLGIILYQILAGRPPFQADSIAALIGMQLNSVPPPLEEIDPVIPGALIALVQAMLLKRPEQRPGMREVAASLGELAGAPANPSRPLRSVPGPAHPRSPPTPVPSPASLPAASKGSARTGLIGGGSLMAVGLAAGLTLVLRRGPTTSGSTALLPPARISARAAPVPREASVPAPQEAVPQQPVPQKPEEKGPAPAEVTARTEEHESPPHPSKSRHPPAAKKEPHAASAGKSGKHPPAVTEAPTTEPTTNRVKNDEDIPFVK